MPGKEEEKVMPMEFWATCIKPGKPVTVNIEEGTTLRLTQVLPLYAESVVHFPRFVPSQLKTERAKMRNAGIHVGSLSEGKRGCNVNRSWILPSAHK